MHSIKRVSSKSLPVFLLQILAVCCHADDVTSPCIISSEEDSIRCTNLTDYSAATANFTDEQVSEVNRVLITSSPDLVLTHGDFHKPIYEHLLRFDHELSNLTSINTEPLRSLNLIWLGYEANNLTAINDDAFTGMESLMTLNLNLNQIETLSAGAFHGLNELETIDLSDNKLSTINPETFNGLKVKYLDLQHNLLTTIEENSFSGLRNLTKVSLASNEITTFNSLAFRNNPELVILDLANNKLESLDIGLLETNNNLLYLDIGQNDLQNLTNFPLTSSSLRYLHLSSCNIHTIPDGYFSQLTHLETLHLDSNKISEIGTNLLPPSPAFRAVFLSDNKLTSLGVARFAQFHRIIEQYPKNKNIADSDKLYRVDLNDNPWDCTTTDMVELRAQEEPHGHFDDIFHCQAVE